MEYYIPILYYSKGGKTKTLAKRIHEIFTAIAPKNFKIEMMSATEPNWEALKKAAAFIIGTPDYFSYPAGQIKIFFDEFYESRNELKDRPVFGFVTHGGTGKAIKPLQELCSSLKLKIITPFISLENEINAKMEAQIQKHCVQIIDLIKAKEN